jgi:phage shock protein PspC (stress-responsive transcriptional regulator)
MTSPPPTPPTEEQPPPQPPRDDDHRRWVRSSSDRMIAGVAGGVGRRLEIDSLAIRITFVILTFAGGLGIVLYLAGLIFMPSDDPDESPLQWGLARTVGAGLLVVAGLAILLPGWAWGPGIPLLAVAGVVVYLLLRVLRERDTPSAGRVAVKIAIAIALLALAAGGFVAAAAGTALGGGIAVAGLVIACGIGMIAGAFRGGARWLALPALVLALPLGAVAATDLDVRGTWGDRLFVPSTVTEVADGYDMGVGQLRVDLRNVDLPPGRTTLPVSIGAGEIQVIVPDGTCVTTEADISMGAYQEPFNGEQGGVDLEIDDEYPVTPGRPELHVLADVGLGALTVGPREYVLTRHDQGWGSDDRVRDTTPPRIACGGRP